jgi:hypothetical protein
VPHLCDICPWQRTVSVLSPHARTHVDIFTLRPKGLGFCRSLLQRLPSSASHVSLPRRQVRDQSQIVRDACAAQAAAQLLRGPEGDMNLGAGCLLDVCAGAGAQKNGMSIAHVISAPRNARTVPHLSAAQS